MASCPFGSCLLENVTLAIGDRHDRVGLHAHATIGERGICARHFDQRGFRGAQRERQERLIVALEAELLGVANDLGRPDFRHRFHRGNVPRVLEGVPQRHRPLELPVVVQRLIRRLIRAGLVRHGLVYENRDRREAAVDRCRVDDRLEERSDLPPCLRGAIELAAREVESADHRANLAGLVVDGQHRAFDEGLLFETELGGDVAIELADLDLDHVADLEERRW